jgi:hypothetical protein
MEEELGNTIDRGGTDDPYFLWQLLDHVRLLRERFDNICLGYEGEFNIEIVKAKLQNTRKRRGEREWRNSKQLNADQFARQEIRDYLKEVYDRSRPAIEEDKKALLQIIIAFHYLCYRFNALLEGREEDVTMKIRSPISQIGEAEVNYLVNHYIEFFSGLGSVTPTEVSSSSPPKATEIRIIGHGVKKIVAYESGYHFFHPQGQSPIPICVEYRDFEGNTPSPANKILRLYSLPADQGQDDTVTDLRTGLVNHSNLNNDDWKFLLFNAIQ